MNRPAYTADNVVKATGLTYRQLDHYIRRGYIQMSNPTPGSGVPRLFTGEQLDRIGTIQALIEAGFKPRAAAEIAQSPEYEHGPVQIQWSPQTIHRTLRERLDA